MIPLTPCLAAPTVIEHSRRARKSPVAQQRRLLATRIKDWKKMIIVTTNDIPGARITQVFGQVFGLTVRSRNIGSSFGSIVKSVRGGELKGVTQLLHDAREEALQRLQVEAEAVGANAVVAFRFETNEYADSGVEVCAYGTAVTI